MLLLWGMGRRGIGEFLFCFCVFFLGIFGEMILGKADRESDSTTRMNGSLMAGVRGVISVVRIMRSSFGNWWVGGSRDLGMLRLWGVSMLILGGSERVGLVE